MTTGLTDGGTERGEGERKVTQGRPNVTRFGGWTTGWAEPGSVVRSQVTREQGSRLPHCGPLGPDDLGGVTLRIRGRLASPLASTHSMPAAPPRCDSPDFRRHCLMSPGG